MSEYICQMSVLLGRNGFGKLFIESTGLIDTFTENRLLCFSMNGVVYFYIGHSRQGH